MEGVSMSGDGRVASLVSHLCGGGGVGCLVGWLSGRVPRLGLVGAVVVCCGGWLV